MLRSADRYRTLLRTGASRSFHYPYRNIFSDSTDFRGQLSYIKFLDLEGVDAIETLLFKATEEALATTGDPTRQAFLWHLRHEGIPFSQNGMNISQVEAKLRQFFGSASSVIIGMIYEKFMTRAMAEGHFSDETLPLLEKLPKNANMQAILRLAVQHRKGIS